MKTVFNCCFLKNKKLKFVFYLLSTSVSLFLLGIQHSLFDPPHDSPAPSFSAYEYREKFNKTDTYIINAYLFPKSKSLGENAVGLILLMNRNTQADMTKYIMKLVATDIDNRSVVVIPKLLEESYSNCAYINMVATTNVPPNLKKLEISDGTEKVKIPFRLGKTTAPAPVIICLSPQFLAEQWQTFIAHAHVAKMFGGHLHLYITSMIDSFFNLVKEYEKHGYVTVDFWIRFKFANTSKGSMEPNAHSELRNQAGAHTDCLYQYKEAASFVAFFDLDDIFIPRGFDSYFDEFSALYKHYPNMTTFQYSKRDTLVYNKAMIQNINFKEIFGHTWFVKRESYGKIISRTENLNSMWVHFSQNVPMNQNHFVNGTNYIIHPQKPIEPDGSDPVPYRTSIFEMIPKMQLNISSVQQLQEDFERLLEMSNIKVIGEELQIGTYYFKIIYRCYYEKFYKTPKKDYCPTSEGCQIPQRSNLNCVHSQANYKSGPPMWPVTYHYHINPRWSRTRGCES